MSTQVSYIFENNVFLKRHMQMFTLCILKNYNIRKIVSTPGGGPGQGGGVAYKNKGAVDEGLRANKNSQVDAWELCG